jgi:hypothetical protein
MKPSTAARAYLRSFDETVTNPGAGEMHFCLFGLCTDRVALVEEDNKRDLLGTDRMVEMLDELIHG